MSRKIPGYPGHLATAAVVVIAAVGWLLVQLGAAGGLPSLGDQYRVKAFVPTTASLATQSRVTMAGAEVGKVKAVERRGTASIVELEITDDDVVPLPADSRVAIRLHTPVGENYVSIEPGRSAERVEDGGTLAIEQADDYVDLDEILSLLEGETRENARRFFQGLGGGVRGRGVELGEVFKGTAATFEDGGQLTLDLVHDRDHIARVVRQFGDVSRAIGERGDSMRSLARRARVAMEAVASRDERVRGMLQELPETLRRARSATATLSRVSDQASPVLTDLAAGVRELQPTFAALRPAAQHGRELLREVDRASAPLQDTLRRVEALAGPTKDALPKLRHALCEVNPFLRHLSPYAQEIVGTLLGVGSATNAYDGLGHLIRVSPIINDSSMPGLPRPVSEAANTLLHAGILQEANGYGYDPYPEAGSLHDMSKTIGILGPKEYDIPYTRVQADC